MNKLNKLIYLLLAAGLSACQFSGEQTEYKGEYFDVAGFASEQVEWLTKVNKGVEKTVTLDGQTEQATLTEVKWEEELKLFIECNLNKPALKGSYTVTEETAGSNSMLRYQAKDTSLRIRLVELLMQDERVAELQIAILEETALFKFEKKLQMKTDEQGHMQYYKVDGGKHISSQEPVNYMIEGWVK